MCTSVVGIFSQTIEWPRGDQDNQDEYTHHDHVQILHRKRRWMVHLNHELEVPVWREKQTVLE